MNIGFDVIETIKDRTSVRTYDEEKPLTDAQRRLIMQYADNLNNPFGVDKVKIAMADKVKLQPGEKLGTYGIIKGAQTYLGLMCQDTQIALLAAGYEFEQLILYITSLGLGTVWLGATFSNKRFSRTMKKPAGYILPAVSPVGTATKRRMVERVMRRFAKSDTRKPWDELFFDGNFTTPLTLWNAGVYDNALEMVRIAPSATNTQPWRIVKINDRFHFYAATKLKPDASELTFRYIDMGIALCHFHLTVINDNIDGEFEINDPKLPNQPVNFRYIASWQPK
ncbi:MAG: hypothetical protein K2N91_00130 [Muribaculaceae bacterium]|nr:hypothetical protein [Muribaculaceae bacterium]